MEPDESHQPVAKNAEHVVGPKTLVLCFDGTSGMYDTNTNVVRFFSLLKKDDVSRQAVYYQTGIGTYRRPGEFNHITWVFSKLLDDCFAKYLPLVVRHLDVHVLGGYEYLMQNYRPGDKICLFGFSRGAYTARALSGMLVKVGLLPRDNHEQVTFAYTMYKNVSRKGWEQSEGFKKTFSSIDVEIEFVGVWDTVSSVGIWWSHYLPFTSSNYIVKTFRQALALDEHRARYQPNLWHGPVDNPRSGPQDQGHSVSNAQAQGEAKAKENAGVRRSPTDVLEVWFSGCHTDIGGGAIENRTLSSLANITLRWMVKECVLTGTGLLFDPNALEQNGIEPRILTDPTSTDPVLTDKQLEDCIQPLHDRLKRYPLWWLLEFLPFHVSHEKKDGYGWTSSWRINLGRGRVVSNLPRQGCLHVSVKQRMERVKGYKARARLPDEPRWAT